MATNPTVIEMGGQKFIRTSDMKIKALFKPNSGTSVESLHDETNANYQVPTGKIFRMLEVYVVTIDIRGEGIKIWDSTTADSATGTEAITKLAGGSLTQTQKYNVSIDFIATHYVNGVTSNTGTNNAWCMVLGIEMNA